MVSSLENFPIMPSLENISLNSNNIADATAFVNQCKDKFPNLYAVNTLRNPMNPGINSMNYVKYKSTIKQIPTLKMLDGMDINQTSQVATINEQRKAEVSHPLANSNPNEGSSNNAGSSNKSTSMSKMFAFTANKPAAAPSASASVAPSTELSPDFVDPNKIPKKKLFTVDESEELDGAGFCKMFKKKSKIQVSELILKKSDNLTKFNRKARSEGNRHILNEHL